MPTNDNKKPDHSQSIIADVQRTQGYEKKAKRPVTVTKVAGELTALSPILGFFKVFYGIFGVMAARIMAMTQEIFNRWSPEYDIPELNDKARFEYVLNATGNKPYIEAMTKNAGVRSMTWFLIFYLIFCLACANLVKDGLLHSFVSGTSKSIISYVLPFALSMIFLTKYVKWSFWHYQMREKSLFSFRHWIRNPSVWLPSSLQGRKIAKLVIVIGGGSLIIQGSLGQAFADTISGSSSIVSTLFGTPSSTDLSMQWLYGMFPSYFSSTGVSFNQDAVAQMFQVINGTLLSVGGVILSYHTVTGIVATAHEGEALGRRWHTMWGVIRVAGGSASIVPVNGYCAAQVISLKVIVASIMMANLAWSAYVTAATANGGQAGVSVAITNPPDQLDDLVTFQDVVAAATCLKDAEYEFRSNGTGSAISISSFTPAEQNDTFSTENNFIDPTQSSSSVSNGDWNFGAACGELKFAALTPAMFATSVTIGTEKATDSPFSSGSSSASPASAMNAYVTARNTAFAKFVSQAVTSSFVNDVAGKIAPDSGVTGSSYQSDYDTLRSEYITYEQAVLKAAGDYSSTTNTAILAAIKSESNDYGWAIAGAIQPELIAINAQVSELAEQTPNVTKGDPDEISDDFEKTVNATSSLLTTTFNNGGLDLGSVAATTSGADSSPISLTDIAEKAGQNPGSVIGLIGSWLWSGTSTQLQEFSSGTALDPITEIAALGNNFENMGVLLFGAAAIAHGAATAGVLDAISFGSGGGGLLGEVAKLAGAGMVASTIAGMAYGAIASLLGLIVPLALALMVMGGFMSVIVPMLSYIYWISAVMALIVFYAEVVIGAAFAGFAHISADGDELIGQKQSMIYGTLLATLFYPTLLVLGLIFANIIMTVSLQFLAYTYTIALQNVTNSGVIDFIMEMGLFSALVWHIISRSYRMITAVPQFTFRYFGINADVNRGDTHGDVTGAVIMPQRSGSMAQKLLQPAGQAMSSGMTQASKASQASKLNQTNSIKGFAETNALKQAASEVTSVDNPDGTMPEGGGPVGNPRG